MKRKDIIISCFLILIPIIIGLSCNKLSEYYNYQNTLSTLDQQIDTQHIYVNFIPVASEDRIPSSYNNVFHFGVNENTLNKINQMGCTSYPYIGLYIHNYGKYGSQFSYEIDGQNSLIDLDNSVLLLPYYKEDQLDEDQIYVSSKLATLIGNNIKGKKLTFDHLEVPTSQTSSKSTYTQYIDSKEMKYEVDCYEVETTEITKEFVINDIIDYSSNFYKSEYVILVPYDTLINIINENSTNIDENKYTIPNFVIFTPNDNNGTYIESIKELDPLLCISSLHQGIANHSNLYHQSMSKDIKYSYAGLIISLLVLLVIGIVFVYSIKEKLLMVLTVMICSVIMGYLCDLSITLLELKIIILPLLCASILILAINIRGNKVFTGTYEQCLKYTEEHHLDSSTIQLDNSTFRSILQRDKANAFVFENGESKKGWKDTYSVYKKK